MVELLLCTDCLCAVLRGCCELGEGIFRNALALLVELVLCGSVSRNGGETGGEIGMRIIWGLGLVWGLCGSCLDRTMFDCSPCTYYHTSQHHPKLSYS